MRGGKCRGEVEIIPSGPPWNLEEILLFLPPKPAHSFTALPVLSLGPSLSGALTLNTNVEDGEYYRKPQPVKTQRNPEHGVPRPSCCIYTTPPLGLRDTLRRSDGEALRARGPRHRLRDYFTYIWQGRCTLELSIVSLYKQDMNGANTGCYGSVDRGNCTDLTLDNWQIMTINRRRNNPLRWAS